ncbi:MAG: peroxidase [Comamonadaceae bacterium]|nr:MAG: peroxidase [Comamonadaceae bacterium]
MDLGEPFVFLFPDAPPLKSEDKKAQLGALATAMIETFSQETEDGIPAVFTYLGQFIDHDMTAGTNTDDVLEALRIDATLIIPQDRQLVQNGLRNMRKGSLQLDSLYGDGPFNSPESTKLQAAMRDPVNPNKMLLGELVRLNGAPPRTERIAPADDNFFDLPRVGAIVGPGKPFADVAALPLPLQPAPGDTSGKWKRKAFIGDSRNDENLIVAQTHLAFLRLHNSFVERGMDFTEARQATVFHYQWLIVNSYLDEVCDRATLSSVIANKAPLYTKFLERVKPTLPLGVLPVPLEFSAAAFRFGHSMVRGVYDFNANFKDATLTQLFQFTGGGPNPVGGAGFDLETLPDNWPIDWVRFLDRAPGRRARPIDTGLASPLGDMVNETTGVFKQLAERNLRRGHVLNLPSAQSVIAALTNMGLEPTTELTSAQLTSGVTGSALQAGGFVDETPLWFYVLKEAEVFGRGKLGPVGSRLVAETIFGLIVHDPDSYLNRTGTPWHPAQMAAGGQASITSLEALFRAAGTMAAI